MTFHSSTAALADALNDALPQTQCTRCGYPDCRAYAEAMARGDAAINQCPPGGTEGIERLSALTGRPTLALNPANGHEGPRQLAVIDEAWCIGCTLCLKACPVDAIVGAAKRMHTVIDRLCTGCELCIPVCPVDCISLANVTGSATGWQAWSAEQAAEAQDRYAFHRLRQQRDEDERSARLAARAQQAAQHVAPHAAETSTALPAASEPQSKESRIAAALARARRRSTA